MSMDGMATGENLPVPSPTPAPNAELPSEGSSPPDVDARLAGLVAYDRERPPVDTRHPLADPGSATGEYLVEGIEDGAEAMRTGVDVPQEPDKDSALSDNSQTYPVASGLDIPHVAVWLQPPNISEDPTTDSSVGDFGQTPSTLVSPATGERSGMNAQRATGAGVAEAADSLRHDVGETVAWEEEPREPAAAETLAEPAGRWKADGSLATDELVESIPEHPVGQHVAEDSGVAGETGEPKDPAAQPVLVPSSRLMHPGAIPGVVTPPGVGRRDTEITREPRVSTITETVCDGGPSMNTHLRLNHFIGSESGSDSVADPPAAERHPIFGSGVNHHEFPWWGRSFPNYDVHVEVVVEAPTDEEMKELLGRVRGSNEDALAEQLKSSNGNGVIPIKDSEDVIRLPAPKPSSEAEKPGEPVQEADANPDGQDPLTEHAAMVDKGAHKRPRTERAVLKVCVSSDGDKISVVMMGSDYKPKAVVEVRQARLTAEHENAAAVDLLDTVARQVLPVELRKTLTLADYTVEVVQADSFREFVDVTVGAILRVIVSSMFHSHGFGVLVPLIGWLTDLLDERPGEAGNSSRRFN
jgi:hypothetical protein